MSASRDASQKIHYIPTNFYRLYRQGLEAAKSADLRGVDSGRVIKADQVHEHSIHAPWVVTLEKKSQARPVAPVEAKAASPEGQGEPMAQSLRVEGVLGQLRENLQGLKAIQGRLRFLTQELDDLTKKSRR